MSTMAWYHLPQAQSGCTLSAGDEFFENQSAGWSLWSFSSCDDHTAAAAYSDERENGARRSEEQTEGMAPLDLEPPPRIQETDDIFLYACFLSTQVKSQFSDEEMRRMDAPFEALDMFPDSMHRLLSYDYENMLSGVLADPEDQDAGAMDRNGIDAIDTCGFPLFSHDLQSDERNAAEPNSSPETAAEPSSGSKAGTSSMKRSRSDSDTESAPPGFEALVLEELEDVVLQLTKKTRICFRDAFYRLAESSSKAKCSAAYGAAAAETGSGGQSFQRAEGMASRVSAAPGRPERETNAIDRTVADLTLKPPCPAPLAVHGFYCAGGDPTGAEARQSMASWTTSA